MLEPEAVPRELREVLVELLDVGGVSEHDATLLLGQGGGAVGPGGGGKWVTSSWEGRTGLLTVGDVRVLGRFVRRSKEESVLRTPVVLSTLPSNAGGDAAGVRVPMFRRVPAHTTR